MTRPNMTGTIPLLRATGIVKSFGRSRILNQLDISLHPRAVTVLRGDNGSGKTTLLSILCLNLSSDSGIVEMPGLGAEQNKNFIRSKIGFVAHSPYLYEKLTVRENLTYFGKLHSVDFIDDVIDASVEVLGIQDRLNVRVDTMSHGLRKRVSIVRSILHDPYVLLLDEPDSGLDSKSEGMLENLIEDYSKAGKSVLITTHGNVLQFRSEVESAFLKQGRLTVSS